MENFLLCIAPFLSKIFFWQVGDESQLINDCFSGDIKNIWKWFFVQLTQLQLLICSLRGKEMKQNTQLMIIRNQGHLLLSQGRCLLFRWIVKSSRDMESDLFYAFVWGLVTLFGCAIKHWKMINLLQVRVRGSLSRRWHCSPGWLDCYAD